jgi:hypothetical protein
MVVLWLSYLLINISGDIEIWNMLRYYQQTLLLLRATINKTTESYCKYTLR